MTTLYALCLMGFVFASYTDAHENYNIRWSNGEPMRVDNVAGCRLTGVISGFVQFTQEAPNLMMIQNEIKGLAPNSMHGIHVHEYGDLSNGCNSTGGHYNPFNMKHGEPQDVERHVGDVGNVKADGNGVAIQLRYDPLIQLHGPFSIVGRAVVIHAHGDKPGRISPGARNACCIIGWMKS